MGCDHTFFNKPYIILNERPPPIDNPSQKFHFYPMSEKTRANDAMIGSVTGMAFRSDNGYVTDDVTQF
jgi:hypothetical protein